MVPEELHDDLKDDPDFLIKNLVGKIKLSDRELTQFDETSHVAESKPSADTLTDLSSSSEESTDDFDFAPPEDDEFVELGASNQAFAQV